MAQFGLFDSNRLRPMQTLDGDFIKADGDHVQVFVKDNRDVESLVGVFKLDKGQCVKQITSKSAGI
jgi:hypothetical protein